jgi:hypothetical protein
MWIITTRIWRNMTMMTSIETEVDVNNNNNDDNNVDFIYKCIINAVSILNIYV